jgi:hypothetical protein
MAGLDGGASLIGFDVRPSDGKLYGVTPDGAIVSLDVKTGKWEKKSQLSEKLPQGATFSVDFNPVADRMRVLSSDGMSLRINSATDAHSFASRGTPAPAVGRGLPGAHSHSGRDYRGHVRTARP